VNLPGVMTIEASNRGVALPGTAHLADAVAILDRSRRLRGLNRPAAALPDLTALSARRPSCPAVAGELALVQAATGAFAAARDGLASARHAYPDHLPLIMVEIEVLSAQHLYADALAAFDAVAVLPDRLRLRRAGMLRRMGRPAEALDHLLALNDQCPGIEGMALDLARTELALDATGAALARLDRLPRDLPVELLRLQALRLDGQAAAAEAPARALATRHPEAAPPALELAQLLDDLDRPEEAAALLDGLPPEMSRRRDAVLLRASLALVLGDPELAWQGHAGQLAQSGADLAAFDGCLAVLAETGPGAVDYRARLDWLYSLPGRMAERGHGNAARFAAEISMSTGAWQQAHRLGAAYVARHKGDGYGPFVLACGALGLGRAAEGAEAARAVLAADPRHPHARAILSESLLIQGDLAGHHAMADGIPLPPGNRAVPVVLRRHGDFLGLGRGDEARRCIERCLPRTTGRPRVELLQALQRFGDVVIPPGEPPPRLRQSAEPMPQRELTWFCDTGIAPEGKLVGLPQCTAAGLAWQLTRERGMSEAEWLARAARATLLHRRIARRPLLDAPSEGLIAPVDPGELAPLIHGGGPYLMVKSHFGPQVLYACVTDFPGVFYAVQRHYGGRPAGLRENMLELAGGSLTSTATLLRCLRAGHPVGFSPDVPAMDWRADRPGGVARGRLFGHDCALSDTVPQLALALDLRCIWVQPVQEGDVIRIEIAELPRPDPAETPAEWCDRWAAAYLARIEALMSGAPENQNLAAPLWRYLLLRGAGQSSGPAPGQ